MMIEMLCREEIVYSLNTRNCNLLVGCVYSTVFMLSNLLEIVPFSKCKWCVRSCALMGCCDWSPCCSHRSLVGRSWGHSRCRPGWVTWLASMRPTTMDAWRMGRRWLPSWPRTCWPPLGPCRCFSCSECVCCRTNCRFARPERGDRWKQSWLISLCFSQNDLE